ncbi:unnamed protein product, partial [Iphiclides podalirius]
MRAFTTSSSRASRQKVVNYLRGNAGIVREDRNYSKQRKEGIADAGYRAIVNSLIGTRPISERELSVDGNFRYFIVEWLVYGWLSERLNCFSWLLLASHFHVMMAMNVKSVWYVGTSRFGALGATDEPIRAAEGRRRYRSVGDLCEDASLHDPSRKLMRSMCAIVPARD